jgi:DNA-binding NarL/FixJ family response regulator
MTPHSPIRVLVAEDQAHVLEALRLLLEAEGYDIETATSPAAILRAVEERELDAVLMDLNYTRDTTSSRERTSGSSASSGRRSISGARCAAGNASRPRTGCCATSRGRT